MWRVYDTCGYPLRQRFNSWNAAYCFLCMMNRLDWTIKKVY